MPLYRQVNEWARHGLQTNVKNLSNWVIRVAEDWLQPLYILMRQLLTAKSVLHVDETYAQIINRSDGKSGQSNAYTGYVVMYEVKVPLSFYLRVHSHVGELY